MVLCGLCVPALAYAEGTLELNASDGVFRSYSAYKLLGGNVSGGSSQRLSDVGYTKALSADDWQELGAPAGTAQDVAEWLSANETPALANEIDWKVEASGAVADKTEITTGACELEDGYWLITSADSSPVLVLVGGNATTKVTEKAETPVLTKQVRTDGDWSDFAVAGNDINPEFRLIGTLPKTYDRFPSYHYQFDDVMDESLTVNQPSIKVVATSADGATTKDLTSEAEIKLSGQRLMVNFADLKKSLPELGGYRTITVTYMARLNTLATFGLAQMNENEATLTYTRKPTRTTVAAAAGAAAEGVSTSSFHSVRAVLSRLPRLHVAASTTDAMSERQQVQVATWLVRLTKKDARNGKKLAKAGFTVRNAKGLYINTDGTAAGEKTDASIWRTDGSGVATVANLANGTYTFREVEVPEGYVAAADVTVRLKGDRRGLRAEAGNATVTAVDSSSGVVDLTIKDSKANGMSGNGGTTTPTSASTKGSGSGMPKTGDNSRVGTAALLIAAGIASLVVSRALVHKDEKRS